MSRLIDADRIIEHIEIALKINRALNLESMEFCEEMLLPFKEEIEKAPTADAVEVKHGHWIEEEDSYDTYFRCSACRELWTSIDGMIPTSMGVNYCPHCGAKMEEVDDDAVQSDT